MKKSFTHKVKDHHSLGREQVWKAEIVYSIFCWCFIPKCQSQQEKQWGEFFFKYTFIVVGGPGGRINLQFLKTQDEQSVGGQVQQRSPPSNNSGSQALGGRTKPTNSRKGRRQQIFLGWHRRNSDQGLRNYNCYINPEWRGIWDTKLANTRHGIFSFLRQCFFFK